MRVAAPPEGLIVNPPLPPAPITQVSLILSVSVEPAELIAADETVGAVTSALAVYLTRLIAFCRVQMGIGNPRYEGVPSGL